MTQDEWRKETKSLEDMYPRTVADPRRTMNFNTLRALGACLGASRWFETTFGRVNEVSVRDVFHQVVKESGPYDGPEMEWIDWYIDQVSEDYYLYEDLEHISGPVSDGYTREHWNKAVDNYCDFIQTLPIWTRTEVTDAAEKSTEAHVE